MPSASLNMVSSTEEESLQARRPNVVLSSPDKGLSSLVVSVVSPSDVVPR